MFLNDKHALMKYSKDWNCHISHCREASNSILNFLSDVFDLANSTHGKPYVPIRDNVIIPRGAVITRVLVAALTGALPSSRLETVYVPDPSIDKCYHDRGFHLLYWTLQFSFAIGNLHASSYYTSLQFKGVRVGKGGHFLNSIKCGDRGGKVKISASFVRCDVWCSCKRPDDSNRRIIRGL